MCPLLGNGMSRTKTFVDRAYFARRNPGCLETAVTSNQGPGSAIHQVYNPRLRSPRRSCRSLDDKL